VDEQLNLAHGLFELAGLQVTSGSITLPTVETIATATVTLKNADGEIRQGMSIGDGPVDAIYSRYRS